VELIHKPSRDNVVPDALSRREEFQVMSTSQSLWRMYKGECDLHRKLREEYVNNPKAQVFVGTRRKLVHYDHRINDSLS
jgi:hypothetical protein